MKKPELLCPAGNLQKLKIACMYGADAVFIGGIEFGLRSNSDNFTIQDIKEGVEFAKTYNADIYVTTNIYAHDNNYKGFAEFVKDLEDAGVKGIIVSDPGYIEICQKVAPKIEIHISTQQSAANKYAVEYYKNLGAHRVVLARELSLEEIKETTNGVSVEIEVFIHGAVCSSYSGRCTMSNHMTMRDSNRGGCSQSCRWEYELMYKEDDQYIAVELDQEEVKFNMSAKDMNALREIPKLIEIGVDSLKVEGRMKSFHYLATVTKIYRQAIDLYLKDPDNYQVNPKWELELQKAESRETYTGAMISDLSKKGQLFGNQYQRNTHEYCGYVLDYNEDTKLALVEQRNHFSIGSSVEFFGPENDLIEIVIEQMYDLDMNPVQRVNQPLTNVYIKVDNKLQKDWLMRKAVK